MTANYLQATEYTKVVSSITGRSLYRNDSRTQYLLSPEFSLAKTRAVCNREIMRWTLDDIWPRVVGTRYESACMALVSLSGRQAFIDSFNGLVRAILAGGREEPKLMVRLGLRRRFAELTFELWQAHQIAAPTETPFDQRTQIDFGMLESSKLHSWFREVAEASNAKEEAMRRRAACCVWRYAMTIVGVSEVGDITPATVRLDAVGLDRGLAIAAVRPLLGIQRRKYGAKLLITEFDWGVGRGKPKLNDDFSDVLASDPSLIDWHALISGWMNSAVTGGMAAKRDAALVFFRYLQACPNVTRQPVEFVSRAYHSPVRFEEWVDQQPYDPATSSRRIGQVAGFFDWYVDVHLAMEDDFGRPVRNPALYNPVTRRKEKPKAAETAREALPIRYLRELIHILKADDFAWARTHKEDYLKRFNPATEQWERIWSPVRSFAMLLKLYLPLRTYQVTMLDSGEADAMVYRGGRWIANDSALARHAGRHPKGFLRLFSDHGNGTEFTGFYVNTNKTADRYKDLQDRGYEIPWQYDDVIHLVTVLQDWQSQFNPLDRPTKWTDLTNPYLLRSHTSAQLAARGANCFLFRDPARSLKDHPIYVGRLQNLWRKLLDELERRVASRDETLPNGQPIRFIEKRDASGAPLVAAFDLHALRVSILTALSVDGGLPLSTLSKCVAGHASVLMTLYYLKPGPAYITEQLAAAQNQMLEREQENYLRFLQSCDLEDAPSVVAFNDQAGLLAVRERNASGWIVGDLGICPVGGALCHVGGPKLTGENGRNDFQPTQGGPRNCVRCRYFLSGPAFLGGLVAHFNSVGLEVMEASEQLRKMQADIGKVEDGLFADSASARPADYRRLDVLYARRETAMQELDVIANNWHSTYAMIERSKVLLKPDGQMAIGGAEQSIRLFASADLADIATAMAECSTFDVCNSICQHASVYPAPTVPTATLRRGRLLDAMLSRNHRQPIFATLSDSEALAAGNELVNLLYARLGTREAQQVIEGKRMLQAVGIGEEVDSMLTKQIGQPVRMSTLLLHDDEEANHGLVLSRDEA